MIADFVCGLCLCVYWYVNICSVCRFCRGCKVECNTNLFNFGGSFLAIDWEPTALHLRYQTTQEKVTTSITQQINTVFVAIYNYSISKL